MITTYVLTTTINGETESYTSTRQSDVMDLLIHRVKVWRAEGYDVRLTGHVWEKFHTDAGGRKVIYEEMEYIEVEETKDAASA